MIPSFTVNELSRSIFEILACEWGLPLFNLLFLSNRWEYHRISYIAKNSATFLLQTVGHFIFR